MNRVWTMYSVLRTIFILENIKTNITSLQGLSNKLDILIGPGDSTDAHIMYVGMSENSPPGS